MTSLNDLPRLSCSRRHFLLGTATTAAGALLAACASEETISTVSDSDIPVGSGIIKDGFVIAQPTAGTFTAWVATCPHQNNPITEINGEYAICKKHGSTFELSSGAVVEGPARDGLAPAQVSHDQSELTVRK